MSLGERRHESCRYGQLTGGFAVDPRTLAEKPIVLPLCAWQVPKPCPPGVTRAWGGNAIETDDCAGCEAYRAIEYLGEP